MIQHGVKACVSLAWMNTCGATPPTATNTSPSSWTSLPYETVAVPPGSWTWSRAAPSRFSKPGWPPALTRGANALRSSRWMDSPGSKAQPLKNSPARGQSWTPSMSCTWLATPWMSAADAFSKNSTTGAGVPPTPYTRPAGCYTPDPACSPHASSTRSSTCSPAITTSPSKSHGASTRTSPGAYRDPNKIRGKALMQAEINTLTSTRVPRGLTELITLGRTLKRRAGDILAYFDHPHTSNGPTEAINGRLEHLRGSALGLAKPHQLHHPSTPRNRRIQTPTTPPIMKSRKSGHCTDDDCGAPGELRAELWG